MFLKDKTEVIEIRAHHLLCILGFCGLGYSEEFVANLKKIITVFRADESREVILIHQCDDVCKYCPHNIGGSCQKNNSFAENSPTTMDLNLLEKLGISSGAVVQFNRAMALIKERINLNFMKSICRDCEWENLGYCEEGLKRGWSLL